MQSFSQALYLHMKALFLFFSQLVFFFFLGVMSCVPPDDYWMTLHIKKKKDPEIELKYTDISQFLHTRKG